MNRALSKLPKGWGGLTHDWAQIKEPLKVCLGKAMMWIFLLSDTFIFMCVLISYMTGRASTAVSWPTQA
jgi:heme/copper-type cytochrome/quinol oxidase subunit 3